MSTSTTDPRLSVEKENGKGFSVPAHVEIFEKICAQIPGLKNHMYMHYMWSNVSCIRVRKGHLREAFSLLLRASGDSFLSAQIMGLTSRELSRLIQGPFGMVCESRARIAISNNNQVDFNGQMVGVNYDTRRINDGYPGFFFYLGTCNAEKFLEMAQQRVESKKKEEQLPKFTPFAILQKVEEVSNER